MKHLRLVIALRIHSGDLGGGILGMLANQHLQFFFRVHAVVIGPIRHRQCVTAPQRYGFALGNRDGLGSAILLEYCHRQKRLCQWQVWFQAQCLLQHVFSLRVIGLA